MIEERFQYRIREMSKFDLVVLLTKYRKELITCSKILKDFAQNNFANEPMHKVICGLKLSDIELLTKEEVWVTE